MRILDLSVAFRELRDLGWVGRRCYSPEKELHMTYTSARIRKLPNQYIEIEIRLDENRRSLRGTFGEAVSDDLGEPWSDFLKRSGYPIDETYLYDGCSVYHDDVHTAMRKIRKARVEQV